MKIKRFLQSLPAALVLLTLCAGITPLASANGGNMPLKKTEIQRASDLAMQAMVTRQALSASSKARVISVETQVARKSKRSTARKAVVQIYDYDRNRLLTTSVNLNNGKVSRTVVNTQIQPPLSSGERNHAIEIALADTQTMNTLSRVYQRITGDPLTDIDTQIKVTPRNFHGLEVRNDDGSSIGDCQRQRCVRLSIVTSDSVQVNVVPVVNLSDESIVTVLRTGTSENMARRMNKNARERRKSRARREAQRRAQQ